VFPSPKKNKSNRKIIPLAKRTLEVILVNESARSFYLGSKGVIFYKLPTSY
jgi:hypothetical protein